MTKENTGCDCVHLHFFRQQAKRPVPHSAQAYSPITPLRVVCVQHCLFSDGTVAALFVCFPSLTEAWPAALKGGAAPPLVVFIIFITHVKK